MTPSTTVNDNGALVAASVSGPGSDNHHYDTGSPVTPARPRPHSLADALRAAGMPPPQGSYGPGSETPSEEDYDENVRPDLAPPSGMSLRRRQMSDRRKLPHKADRVIIREDHSLRIYPDDQKALQDFLKRSSERLRDPDAVAKRTNFADFVFSKQFSTFDRNNSDAANSPFHGFYNLFWLGVALFVFKISADNWRNYGNPLGSYDIVRTMFCRDGTSNPRLL